MKQRLGHPATRAVAQAKRRDFSPVLAACGGGHVPVPGVARLEFHDSRVGRGRWKTSKTRRLHRGHATAEAIVALLALAPFFVGIPLLGKQLDMKHKSYDATRYSVWERTVYRSDGAQKSVADIELEARDRTLGNARAGMLSAARLRNAGGVTENVLWRDRAGQRLLAAASRNGPRPITFNDTAGASPVEVGRVIVPQVAYGGGVANAAMAALGLDGIGVNRNSFVTAGVSMRVRPTLGELADRPFALRRSRGQNRNRQPIEQAARGGILSDTWSPNSEAMQRTRVDNLVANERVWQLEMAGMALGFFGGKGTPLYGEGQYGFGRGYLDGPDFTVPSTSLPNNYVYTPRQR